MASYTANLSSSFLTDSLDINFTNLLSSENSPASADDIQVSFTSGLSGSITSIGTVSVCGKVSGLGANIVSSLSKDLYGKVYVYPFDETSVDLGLITENGQSYLTLWNLSNVNTICSSTTITNSTGITKNIVTPFTLAAFEDTVVTYTMSLEGPQNIDSISTYIFTLNNVTYEIIATRGFTVPLWPEDDITETFEWLTDVLTTWTGIEQRIKLRNNPRRGLQFTLWPTTDAEAQLIDNVINYYRSVPWLVPIYSEFMRSTTIPLTGDYTIYVDTTHMSLVVGNSCMIFYDDNRTRQTLVIGSFTTTSITFTIAMAVPSGTTIVYVCPTQKSRFKSTPEKTRQSGTQDYFNLDFISNVDPIIPILTTFDTYGNYDIFLYKSYLYDSSTQKVTYEKVVSEVDYKTGTVYWDSPVSYTSEAIEIQALCLTYDEAFYIRDFLMTRQGKVVPFWYPLYNSHMNLNTNIISGNSTVIVDDCNYYLFNSSDIKKHIFMELNDGTKFYREIESIISSEYSEIITVTESFNQNISTSDIKTLCFLGLFRLNEDTNTLKWSTYPVMTCTFSIMEITG